MKALFLLLLPLSVCAQAQKKPFEIQADLRLAKAIDKVFISYRTDDEAVRDSIVPVNGRFTHKGMIAEPTAASLQVRYVKSAGEDKSSQESVQIFIEPAVMRFTATDSLKNHQFTGSKAHPDFLEVLKITQEFENARTELSKAYSEARGANDEAAMKQTSLDFEKIYQAAKTGYAAFVRSKPRSGAALYAVKQAAGYQIDPEVAEPLFLLLPEDIRAWPSAVAFARQLEIARKTAIGQPAMEFVQNDTLGNPVALSSFRGKYVLIDFWASWCGPCRRENPNLVKTFNLFKDKNFTILGVSLDRPNAKDKWLKAIAADGLTWTQVSDLKFWDNEVAKQYDIRSIPQNLLLDPEGKIIAKNLRGEDLTKKLAEILGQ